MWCLNRPINQSEMEFRQLQKCNVLLLTCVKASKRSLVLEQKHAIWLRNRFLTFRNVRTDSDPIDFPPLSIFAAWIVECGNNLQLATKLYVCEYLGASLKAIQVFDYGRHYAQLSIQSSITFRIRLRSWFLRKNAFCAYFRFHMSKLIYVFSVVKFHESAFECH